MKIETGVHKDTGLPAQEHIQKVTMDAFLEKIQDRLDSFARSEGRFYDNMISACTYATSTNPVFSREGQYCVEARDATWAVANAIMNEVLSGDRPIPTWEELEAELPALMWPTV